MLIYGNKVIYSQKDIKGISRGNLLEE